MEEVCFLCDQALLPDSLITLKKKAIETVTAASLRRKDKKHLKLQNLWSLNIHRSCYARYIREAAIKAAEKKNKENNSMARKINKEARQFDFTTTCFICGASALPNSKKKVSHVQSDQIRTNILDRLRERSTKGEFNKTLHARLKSVSDLSEAQGRYHPICLSRFYSQSRNKSNIVGAPLKENTENFMQHILTYILDNDDECQFSLNQIKSTFMDDVPEKTTIKVHLRERLGDSVSFRSTNGDLIISVTDPKDVLLREQCRGSEPPKEEEDRRRIVECAANIILQDVRDKVYDTSTCKTSNSCLDNSNEDIPPSLQLFLDVLIKKNKHLENEHVKLKWERRVATLAHSAISSVRPRSFLSSILLGLSASMHNKGVPKNLIDSLSYLGLCSSYDETMRLGDSPIRKLKVKDIFDKILEESQVMDSLASTDMDFEEIEMMDCVKVEMEEQPSNEDDNNDVDVDHSLDEDLNETEVMDLKNEAEQDVQSASDEKNSTVVNTAKK